MKTIRTNCFETNSSSTHSITVNAKVDLAAKPIMTFLPNENGVIIANVGVNGDPESSMQDKLNFLLTFTYYTSDQKGFDLVKKTVEDFTKLPLTVEAMNYSKERGRFSESISVVREYSASDVDEDAEDEFGHEECSDQPWFGTVNDEFYSYVSEYGHESVDDFVAETRKILRSEQSVLVFIFTNHLAFAREAHYG